MIGVVIVSHSAKLAEGVVELARQVAHDKVHVAAAGGTNDSANPIGTDAFRVLEAIEAVDDGDGVLVFTDLGSAVLSAETALELLDESRRSRIRLSHAPTVEGAIAAVSLAAAGGTLDEIAAEPESAITAKAPAAIATGDERQVTLPNRLGLHARPAARMIRLLRRFNALVTVENLTAHTGPANAASLNAILSLRARQGHQILLRGPREAIAELARFLESGCGDTDVPQTAEPAGIGASGGIAIGPLARFHTAPSEILPRTATDPNAEWRLMQAALETAAAEIRGLDDPTGIFDAQSLLLEDAELIGQARRLVFDDRRDAASAWHSASQSFIQRLAAIDDPYLSARAADLSDVAGRVLAKITGTAAETLQLTEPSIVAAHDVVPSQVEKFDPALVLGLCLEAGSATAHASILARARGIPTVVGLGPALAAVAGGTIVAIDGEHGKIWVAPTEDEKRHIAQLNRSWLEARQTAQANRAAAAVTRDGRRITLLANLSRETQAVEALECGAEGVGVLRTEFLFLDRTTPPCEDEQFECYRNIAEVLGDRPLVIRTLDIGGDKGVPYVDIGAESNPFLGWRGIRLMLGRRDLFETQVRAILRASPGHPIEILLPMISTLEELLEAKSVVRRMESALGLPNQMPVGVMIEVPSAAAIADQLAAEASRLSIGTNDLVQYVMAADRTNSRVAHIADHFQPAVLRTIHAVAQAACSAGVRVDVCGEMAADPLATPILLGLGVEELSMSPPLIAEIKRTVSRWSMADAQALAHEALHAQSSDAVRRLVL
jgi:phosphocarrier protein FPr